MSVPVIVISAPTSNEIYVGDTRHLSARDIARRYGYARDYVARLCRQGKVRGHQLGRLWYVDDQSFAAFVRDNDNPAAPEPHQATV